MRKTWPALALALSSLGWSPATQAAEVLVSAAASLTDALTEIGRAYESNGKARVRFNFGSSSELARQIDEGAPADIYFSADLEKMDALERKGRIDPATRKNLLSNRLVLVVPKDSKLNLRAPKDLLRPEVKRIALAQPETVPVGIYVKTYLESEGLCEKVASKIIPVLDVRATLTSVESGNVDAGFVYKTDAAISKKTKVFYEVPLDKGPKIVYPAAAIKESKNKEAAGDFLKFVSSQAGKKVFRKYGFVVLE
jgi:molybdate transport system substrate-binding protein